MLRRKRTKNFAFDSSCYNCGKPTRRRKYSVAGRDFRICVECEKKHRSTDWNKFKQKQDEKETEFNPYYTKDEDDREIESDRYMR